MEIKNINQIVSKYYVKCEKRHQFPKVNEKKTNIMFGVENRFSGQQKLLNKRSELV